jgi:transposase
MIPELEHLEQIIRGQKCPRCQHTHLYRLQDQRYQCAQCSLKISIRKLRTAVALLHYFSLEIPANKTAKDLHLSYRTVHQHYALFRQEIVQFLAEKKPQLSGEIECDESYFGGKQKGHRGLGASGKVIVFGMLERQGRILTTIVDNVSARTLLKHIKTQAVKGSVFYTDRFRSYKSLQRYGRHIQVDHSATFASGVNHINGLEGFWSFAKERLLKYHGISKKHFLFYLKEMEFRYNYRKENLYQLLLKIHFSPEFN